MPWAIIIKSVSNSLSENVRSLTCESRKISLKRSNNRKEAKHQNLKKVINLGLGPDIVTKRKQINY